MNNEKTDWLWLLGFGRKRKKKHFLAQTTPSQRSRAGSHNKTFFKGKTMLGVPKTQHNTIQFLFWWHVGAASEDCARSLFLPFRPRMTTLGFAHFNAGGFAGKGKKKGGERKDRAKNAHMHACEKNSCKKEEERQ